jgi:hypothetical protein
MGGAIAALAGICLPELRAMWRAQERPTFPRWKIVVGLAMGACLTLLGGAAAVFLGDATQAKHAIAYGISAEAIFGEPMKRRFG